MNVGELRERLDDWGDHIPVRVVVNRGENDRVFDEFDVDDYTRSGEMAVEITVEL